MLLNRRHAESRRRAAHAVTVCALCIAAALCAGCFLDVSPESDREARILEALNNEGAKPVPPSPLSAQQAVVYALAHNLDSRVAELETAYQNENLAASKRRLLPSLTARHSFDRNSHPSARWSQGLATGRESLESSFSSEQTARRGEIGVVWDLIDFGVGYLKSRQQAERAQNARLQQERVRQQVVLDVLSRYWHAAFTASAAAEAEALRQELEDHAGSIRDSVEMRILSGAEGARRELAVYNGLSELDQWRRSAAQAKLELARVMGAGMATDFDIEAFPSEPFRLPAVADRDPEALQAAALKRRPELHQSDGEERIALDDARMALLQIAPNASLSFNLHHDADKFLAWNNWMALGARASWNLLNIPARLSERRAAKLQGELAKQKGLALAAAVMAQVGIAWSDWRLAHEYAASLHRRVGARARLVEALAAGQRDGQARAGEVLQERVRLLSERAAAMRAGAEAMISGARLANAVGVDTDAEGAFVWSFDDSGTDRILAAESDAALMFPGTLSGVEVVKPDGFVTQEAYSAKPDAGDAGAVPVPGPADFSAERREAEAERGRINRDLEKDRANRERDARGERERRRQRLLRGDK